MTATTTRAAADAPFLVAARGGEPRRRPLWIMRQAGRYLPEYRALKERHSFLELCSTPGLATEVTLQPLRRFDLDAAILFTDLLIPVQAMGIPLRYEPGPVLGRRLQSAADVDALVPPDAERDLAPMLAAARGVRAALPPDKALIGFVGAPFTMSCYLVEGRGSKDWSGVRRLRHEDEGTFARLQERLADCLEPLVRALVHAGCDAIQVFDSWVSVLGSADYARFCARPTERLLQTAREEGAVAIDFLNGAAAHLDTVARTGADVVAVDWRLPLDRVRAALPDRIAVQGNLDPTALFLPDDDLRAAVRAVCRAAGPRGHIFNLGHGILPDTDPGKVALVAEEVHRA